MARPGKAPLNVRSIARGHTEEAIDTLLYWMRQHENAKASVSAAQYIIDRGWGKAEQTVNANINDKRDAADWTRDELVAFLNDARARRDGVVEAAERGGKPDRVH